MEPRRSVFKIVHRPAVHVVLVCVLVLVVHAVLVCVLASVSCRGASPGGHFLEWDFGKMRGQHPVSKSEGARKKEYFTHDPSSRLVVLHRYRSLDQRIHYGADMVRLELVIGERLVARGQNIEGEVRVVNQSARDLLLPHGLLTLVLKDRWGRDIAGPEFCSVLVARRRAVETWDVSSFYTSDLRPGTFKISFVLSAWNPRDYDFLGSVDFWVGQVTSPEITVTIVDDLADTPLKSDQH